MFSGTYQDSADTQNLLELLFIRFQVWNRARNLFETLLKKIKERRLLSINFCGMLLYRAGSEGFCLGLFRNPAPC